MKVLLVIPTYGYDNYPTFVAHSDFPVGFAYLAAAAKAAGFRVFGLNPNNDASYASAYEMLADKLGSALAEVQPDLVGIGGLCTDYRFLKDAVSIIRRCAPAAQVVMGGGIVTYDPEFAFSRLKPDYCIIGEGEEVLVALLSQLQSGAPNLAAVPNLGYWREDSAVFTRKETRYPDLDSRPFPDYEPFGIARSLDDYSHAARYLYRYTRPDPRPMTIITGRGCPFSCTFCVHERGLKYRTRSLDKIMEEIALLYERYRFNILIILDELFAAHKDRVRDFSLAVLKGRRELGWDFDWLFQTHASSSLDEETLRLAKEAGCYYFSYGIESASPTVIASMNKRSSTEQITRAIAVAEKGEIGFGGNFIFGDVAETFATIAETMDFFDQHCRDIHIFLGHIQPYPGSALYDDCLKRGIIGDRAGSYDNIDGCYNMTGISTFLWHRWLFSMERTANRFEWCRPAEAYHVEVDRSLSSNPVVRASGGEMYQVRVLCPCCGHDNTYKEILVPAAARPRQSLGQQVLPFLSRILVPVLGCFIPAFRATGLLKAKAPLPESRFLTGCRKCNKRYNVIYNELR